MRKWITRNRAISISVLVVLLAVAVAGFGLFAALSTRNAPGNADREAPPEPRAPHKGQYLPGLVPAPTFVPEVGRWQLITKKPRGRMESAIWNPDETRIAVGEAGNIRIYDAENLRLLHVLVGHTRHVASIDWHPDGHRLASASWDGTVRLWTADGIPTHRLEGHEGEVYQVAWHPDGEQLASVVADGTARLWKADGTPEAVLRDHHNHVFCLDWSPDGRLLATGGGDIRPRDQNGNAGDNVIRIWNIDAESVVARLAGHLFSVECLAWHPDGDRLASGDSDSGRVDLAAASVRVWSVEGRRGRFWAIKSKVCVPWRGSPGEHACLRWERRSLHLAIG